MIKVGAATEIEMKEKKARVEDAMHATARLSKKASWPAAASRLLRARKVLDKLQADERRRTVGVKIVRVLSKSRFARSRRTPGEKARSSSQRSSEGNDNFGFNAATEKYEDLVAAGVIDPAKVTAPLSKTQPRSPASCSRPKP